MSHIWIASSFAPEHRNRNKEFIACDTLLICLIFGVMSDAELDNSPSSNTRSSSYSRRAFAPITERMSGTNPVKKSEVARSPKSKRTPKLPSSPKLTRSPKIRKRPIKKNIIYPDLAEQVDDYDEVDADTSENEDITDSSRNDEADDNIRESSPVRKRSKAPGSRDKKIYPSLDEFRSPPTKQRRGTGQLNNQPRNGSILLYIIIVFACLLVVYLYFSGTKDEVKSEIPPSMIDLFKTRFEKIKAKYPSQTTRFWRIVGSQMKRLLTEDKMTYPAVVLLSVSKKSSNIGSCFSSDVVSALNDVFNSTSSGYVDVISTTKESDDAAKIKRALDDQLIQKLENGRGVVLDHIERIPAQAALLLHGYCDGDNAPYKQSAIFLGLHTDNVEKDRHDVDDILTELWESELGSDEMPALLSRIGNSVVVLSHEPNFKC